MTDAHERPATPIIAFVWSGTSSIGYAWPDIEDFVLVSSPEQYEVVVGLGYEAICVQLRSSDYFHAALPLRLLGRLAIPWRWRRVLLNECIEKVYVPLSMKSMPVVLACLLTGAKVALGRTLKRQTEERVAWAEGAID